jgi:tetratricopeptide (TPR) repeat protein
MRRSIGDQVKLQPGVFQFVDKKIRHYPKALFPQHYQPTSWGFLKQGEKEYNRARFKEALENFQKSLKLQPENKEALLGKVLAMFKLKSDHDLSVQFACLRIINSIQSPSDEYPQEWDGDMRQVHVQILKNLYTYGLTLYAHEAFEEVVGFLDCYCSEFLLENVLFLDLKFKSLWALNKPSSNLWECGELLKKCATEANLNLQNLTSAEKFMVQDTLSRHLSFKYRNHKKASFDSQGTEIFTNSAS